MKKIILSIICMYLSLGLIQAQERPYKQFGIDNSSENLPHGLNPGDLAPNFTLKDSKGASHELKGSLDRPLVLIFYRGVWCGQCNKYLSRVQDSLSQIEKAGARIWAITPETQENAEKIQESVNLDFPLLSDKEEEVMKAYDVIFNVTKKYQNKISVGKFTSISENNGQDEAHLPVPATFIIGVDQKIIYSHFDYDYKKRASVGAILEALEN